jgi:molybdopterin molybdotransferase
VRAALRRISIAEALLAMAQLPVRKAGIEALDLRSAEGRVLARGVDAPEDVPGFDRSMVDGYAVVAADVRGADPEHPIRLTLAGEVAMGKPPAIALLRGQAIAVPTGGALPAGTTGLIKVEDTKTRDGEILVYESAGCEDRITAAASDVRAGEHLFSPGVVLDPAALGLLAASGIASVSVYREPVVGVLITGDELVPAGRPLEVGQIRESNGVTICAALSAMGFAPRRYERVADEREIFEAAFARALSECDAIVISGGSSVGARDHTPAVVAQAGEPGVIVHGVRAKPGRPVLLAMIGDRPVIGLPGNPVSALVMLEALAKPILMRMFDRHDTPLPVRATLEENIEVEPGLEYRIPVQLRRGADGVTARPLLGSSSQMHILGFADAIIVVPEGSTGLAAGAEVDALLFSATRTSS